MKIRAAIPCLIFLCVSATCALGQTSQTPDSQKPAQAGSSSPSAGSPETGPSGAGADSATPAKIDPAKEADIRKLLDVAGGTAAMNQVLDGMQANLKVSLANALPPGEYRDQLVNLFFEKFRSKADLHQLTEIAVQVYDKYLSDDDIKGLIQFYSTPLGQKTISLLPKVTVEMQSAGMRWGQKLGQESMREVLLEHPELAKALEDSQKNNTPHQ